MHRGLENGEVVSHKSQLLRKPEKGSLVFLTSLPSFLNEFTVITIMLFSTKIIFSVEFYVELRNHVLILCYEIFRGLCMGQGHDVD